VDQTISKGAMTKLFNHSWPGNVRELKNVIERASVLSDTDEIGLESILLSHETESFSCHTGFRLQGRTSLKKRIAGLETEILLDALNSTASVRQAARGLGLSHTALLKKIAKYNLQIGNKKNRWNKIVPS
jgi:transcriptional regulator of aroF, aroG, tyrA and aromatic amino acid transport